VVGTSEGLAGLGIQDGVQARVADRPERFADAVVDVLRRDDLADGLGRAGRAHVERHFGWESVGARFLEVVRQVLAK
jgi:glycosyltransferase involved in cell wall biosynthesis